MPLPDLTQQPVLFVDGTPDDEYPKRILSAYIQHATCNWVSDNTGDTPPNNPMLAQMNRDNAKRRTILQRAMARLENKA